MQHIYYDCLLPKVGESRKFSQLYIYCGEDETLNQINGVRYIIFVFILVRLSYVSLIDIIYICLILYNKIFILDIKKTASAIVIDPSIVIILI